jgi:hypothetical protein
MPVLGEPALCVVWRDCAARISNPVRQLTRQPCADSRPSQIRQTSTEDKPGYADDDCICVRGGVANEPNQPGAPTFSLHMSGPNPLSAQQVAHLRGRTGVMVSESLPSESTQAVNIWQFRKTRFPSSANLSMLTASGPFLAGISSL